MVIAPFTVLYRRPELPAVPIFTLMAPFTVSACTGPPMDDARTAPFTVRASTEPDTPSIDRPPFTVRA